MIGSGVQKYCCFTSAICLCRHRSLPVVASSQTHVAIRRFHEKPVAIHTDTVIADVDAAGGLPGIVPELTAGARIDGPGVVDGTQIGTVVDHEGSAFNVGGCGGTAPEIRIALFVLAAGTRRVGRHVGFIEPLQGQLVDVGLIDLVEHAVALAGIAMCDATWRMQSAARAQARKA